MKPHTATSRRSFLLSSGTSAAVVLAPPALFLTRPSRAIAEDEAVEPSSTTPSAAPAAPPPDQQEDLPPFVREALKRTEENRERRRIERLRAYDRKNFGDYFTYDSGLSGAMRGVKPETRKAIEKWLEENK